MQRITPRQDLRVAAERGRAVIELSAGTSYIMHDVEITSGKTANAFEKIDAIPQSPVPIDASLASIGESIIVPFIGGLGDAISLLPILGGLHTRWPGTAIDVSTTSGNAEVFAMCPLVRNVHPYPLTTEQWERYASYLSLEAVQRDQPGRSIVETISAVVGIQSTAEIPITLPDMPVEQDAEDRPPVIGIAIGESADLRALPDARLLELINRLIGSGIACVLFGHADPDRPLPAAPPYLTDMRGKTSTIAELAVWLKVMDVVVAHDSFIMHLAGAVGCPTVALFAPTSAAHATPYARTFSLLSDAPCAPCHVARGSCPLGYEQCQAWDQANISPEVIEAAVRERLERECVGSMTG